MGLRTIAIWCVATTAILLVMVSAGVVMPPVTFLLAALLGIGGAGWFVFKSVPANQRIPVVTIAVVGVLIAGYIAPLGIEELALSLELADQFVMGLLALSVVITLGMSLEAIRRITFVEPN